MATTSGRRQFLPELRLLFKTECVYRIELIKDLRKNTMDCIFPVQRTQTSDRPAGRWSVKRKIVLLLCGREERDNIGRCLS